MSSRNVNHIPECSQNISQAGDLIQLFDSINRFTTGESGKNILDDVTSIDL
jgi:hypothetical protein